MRRRTKLLALGAAVVLATQPLRGSCCVREILPTLPPVLAWSWPIIKHRLQAVLLPLLPEQMQ